MSERISLMVGRLFTGLQREEGQGATEYAMVIGFVVVGLTITLGVLGVAINFLDVATRSTPMVPGPGARTVRRSEHGVACVPHGTGLSTVDARPRGSSERSSRRQERFRSEDGQSAVEFALIVPLLLLIIIAILHFGKVMNYWLDLNHVASEGARKAAPSPATPGTRRTRAAGDGELRTGGTTSIPSPATIAVCLPEGSDVGDPSRCRSRSTACPSSARPLRSAARPRCASSSLPITPAAGACT